MLVKKIRIFILGLGLVSGWLTATEVSPLSRSVWVDLSGHYYYQEPVSIISTADDIAASVRVYEKFPYRKVVKQGDEYAISELSSKQFNALSAELIEHGKRLRGDFDGDGKPDIVIETPSGDELLISDGKVKTFGLLGDLASISNMQVVDLNSDLKDDLLDLSANTVQYATTDGFTQAVGTSEYVGSLSGDSNVSPIGNFNYSVSVTTGESTGGLKPNVSLSYSSNPANGHLGVGWAIGGMSGISRCEQNVETDGNVTKVNFTSSDKFCLDNQRLIVKNGQTYGANNSEYRTAQDSFQKVVAYTSNTAKGPDRFVVYDTSGNIFHYGKYSTNTNGIIQTTDAKHFAWALSRVVDASGNYYSYTYGKVAGSLEYYPTRIDYSGHASHSTKNKIIFNYEARNDTSESYFAGYKTSVTQRLKSVESYYGNELLKRYKLTYKMDLTAFGHSGSSLLEAITACDSTNKCISPTVFSWNARNLNSSSRSQSKDFSRTSRYKGHQLLDFNGDGLLDIAYVRNDRGSSTDHLYLIRNNGSTLTHIKTYNDIASKAFRRTWKIVDYDKDGDDDILYLPSTSANWKLIKFTSGSHFTVQTLNTLPRPDSDARSRFVDMNADGMADLMHIVNNKLTVQKGTKSGVSNTQTAVQIALVKHYSHSSVSLLDYDRDDNTFTSTDFNGDGRADVIVQVRERVVNHDAPCRTRPCHDLRSIDPVTSSPNSTTPSTTAAELNVSVASMTHEAAAQANQVFGAIIAADPKQRNATDVSLANGAYTPSFEGMEPLQKLALQAKIQSGIANPQYSATTYNSWRILLSEPGTNGAFKLAEYAKLWSTASVDKVMPMNINGDGLTDLLYRVKGNKKWYAVINNGKGFNAPKFLRMIDEDYLVTFDVNADGRSEIVYKQGRLLYFIGYEKGNFVSRYYGAESADYNELNFVDMDGDGVQDRFLFKGRSHTDFRSDTGANRIVRVTDGFGNETSVNYQTLNDPRVYTRETNGASKNWGNGSLVSDIKGAIRVVSSLYKNGDQLTYRYTGGKAQIGRGLLGYRQVSITSLASAVRTTSTYRQDGIYRGSPTEVKVEAITRNTTTNPPNDCDLDPYFCECQRSRNDRCQLSGINGAQTSNLSSSQTASVATTQDTTTTLSYKLKSKTQYTYGVKTNNSFVIGSLTKAQAVYPSKTVSYLYNIDSTANELLVTNTKEVSLTSYGKPVTEVSTHNGKYVLTKSTGNNTYSTSAYGGRLTKKVLNAQRTNKYNVTTVEPAVTLTSTYVYDSKGRLTKSTADNGVTTTYTINAYGLATKQVVVKSGLASRIINTKYDAYGRHVTEKSNELGHKTQVVYTNKGFKNYDVSANGQRVYYGYNGLGRHINEISTPQNNTSKTGSYALTSSKVQYWCSGVSHCPSNAIYYEEITQEGSPTSRTYTDKLGNGVRSASQSLKVGSWVFKDTTYDSFSRKISESVPYLSTTNNSLKATVKYDAQNRVIELTQADGGVWKTSYNGFTVTSTNPTNHVNTKLKNGLGEVIEVKDANQKVARYLYDVLGNLRKITDPNSNTINVTYDKYANKTKLDDPDAGIVSYQYNAYHELVKQTDANGNVITLSYDKLGRASREIRKTKTGVTEHDFTTTYDAGAFALGHLSKMRDAVTGHEEQYFYDTFSRVKEKRTLFEQYSYSEKSSYDSAGRLVEEIDASGSGIKHIYNSHNWAYQVRKLITQANKDTQ